MIGRARPRLVIAMVDENSPASGPAAGFYVAPAITDHIARGQIDRVVLCRLRNQSRQRLAAFTLIEVVMRADTKVGEPEGVGNPTIGLLNKSLRYRAPSDLWLIGNHDEQIAELGKLAAGRRYPIENLDLLWRLHRVGLAVSNDRTNKHPIAVEEDRPIMLSLAHGCIRRE